MNNIYGYGGADAQQQPYVDENDPYADVNPAVLQHILSPNPQQPQQSPYQPRTEAMQAFNTAASQVPQHSQYEPSTGRKILATMAGFGDYKVGRDIADAPYNNAFEDWANKLKPLQFGAQQEESRNVEQRRYLDEQQRIDISEQRAETYRKQQEATSERYRQLGETSRKRADTYKYKAEHPNWIHVVDENGYLTFVNPQNPEKTYTSEIKLTTPQEKNEWQVAGKLKEIQATIAGRLKEIGAQGEEARKTKETTPAPKPITPVKPPSASQEKVGVYNKAQKALADNPDLKGYIQLGQGNTVALTMPFMGDKSKFDRAHDLIYGSATSITPDVRQKAIDELTKAKKPVTEANIKYVMDQLNKK